MSMARPLLVGRPTAAGDRPWPSRAEAEMRPIVLCAGSLWMAACAAPQASSSMTRCGGGCDLAAPTRDDLGEPEPADLSSTVDGGAGGDLAHASPDLGPIDDGTIP